MRLVASVFAVAAALKHKPFSALEIIRAAKGRDMDMDTAFKHAALPVALQHYIETGEHSDAMLQFAGSGAQDTATTAAPKDPFTKAVGFINTELVVAQEKVDIVVYDCNVFRTEKEQLLLENSNLLSALGASIAQATATISQAKGTLAVLNTELAGLQAEFEAEQAVCKETLDGLQHHIDALTGDLEVAELIYRVADKECNPQGAAAAAPFLLQSCMEPKTGEKTLKVTGKIGEAMDKLQSKDGKFALQAVLSDSVATEEHEEEHEETYETEDNEGDDEIPVEVANVEEAEKAYQEEDREELKEDMDVAAFLQVRNTQTELAPPGKCTTGGKIDCGDLMDKIDQMVGDIRTELDAVKGEFKVTYEDCEARRVQKETQISDLSAQVAESETILAEATATLLKDTQSQQNAEAEKEVLEGELAARMKECHTDIKNIDSSICALSKVRNALFKQIKKSNPLIQDCEMSEWIEGECSVPCDGKGMMVVTRNVLASPGEYGAACSPAKLDRECDNGPCPIDCKMGEWSEWSKCTKECGGGVESHVRNIIREAEHGGQPCEETSSSRACNTQSCDVDCVLAEWTQWGKCSKACKALPQDEAGIQWRKKHVAEPAQGQGKCPHPNADERLQSQECNAELCPEDIKCISNMDAVVIYDGSGSVTNWRGRTKKQKESKFNKQKEFAKRMIEASNMGWDDNTDQPSGLRWSIMQFSSRVRVLNRLAEKKEDQDKEKLMKAIDADKFMRGGTAMSKALTMANSILKESNPDRLSVAILLTDGRPNNRRATLAAAKKMKSDGVRVVIIPVGRRVPIKFMCKVASAPCRQNMIRARSFSSLIRSLNRFYVGFCPEIEKWSDVPPPSDTLAKEEALYPGEELLSKSGQWQAAFQHDGNFCVNKKADGGAGWNFGGWCSMTNGKGKPNKLVMQGDGNLVLYRGNSAKWASDTHGKKGEKLVMQDDGNLVLYDAGNKALFDSQGHSKNQGSKKR